MDETKTEIQTKQSIAKVEAQLDNIPFDTKDEYLREKEKQLRDSLKQLRDSLKQLHERLNLFLQQTFQPGIFFKLIYLILLLVAYKKRKLSDLDDGSFFFLGLK